MCENFDASKVIITKDKKPDEDFLPTKPPDSQGKKRVDKEFKIFESIYNTFCGFPFLHFFDKIDLNFAVLLSVVVFCFGLRFLVSISNICYDFDFSTLEASIFYIMITVE